MLPPVSDPIAAVAEPTDTAAAEPPEDPPGILLGSQGLRAGWLTTPAANSCVTVLPITMPPARRSISTEVESSVAALARARDFELHFVGEPATSKMSLMPSGMPCRG